MLVFMFQTETLAKRGEQNNADLLHNHKLL